MVLSLSYLIAAYDYLIMNKDKCAGCTWKLKKGKFKKIQKTQKFQIKFPIFFSLIIYLTVNIKESYY